MNEPVDGGRRRRALYGRRIGRPLSAERKRLLDSLLPRVQVPLPQSQRDGSASEKDRLNALNLFTGGAVLPAGRAVRPREAWLEVGFGGGEHLAAQAAARPEIGFIGCEPFVNGVASLLAKIARMRLENVRVHADDARALIDCLGDASIGRVFVLFPDPWPKSRHAKRRFITGATLDALARVMTDGAELRLATDDMPYIRWSLGQILPHPAFEWLAEGPADWRNRPSDQPSSRYEEKARAKGVTPVFLTFRRRGRIRR